MPFRDAYTIVGRLVNYCIDAGKTLETLELNEYRKMSELFEADVYTAIALETCVASRNVPGGPAEKSVQSQMNYIRRFLEERH